MYSANTKVDYRNTIFEYPDLTRIIGEPATASHLKLSKEVRANASAVHTDLGGGEDGHLGLVCTPEVHATLAPGAEPYVRPENPGRLALKD